MVVQKKDYGIRAPGLAHATQGGYELAEAQDDIRESRRKDGLRAKQSMQASWSRFWGFDGEIASYLCYTTRRKNP